MGKQEGIRIGEEKGIKIGKKEEKLEIAKAMLQEGDPIEKIIRITGLYESDIQQLF